MLSGAMKGALKGLSKSGAVGSGGGVRRTLRKGMSGMDVARCQNLLNRELAFAPPPLWVDGIFGPKTDRKVRDFQVKKRLTVDGIVGPATWTALEGWPIASRPGDGGAGAGGGAGGGGGIIVPATGGV